MRIKIDGENEVFIIADQTGLKFYNIGKFWSFLTRGDQKSYIFWINHLL